MFDLEPSVSPYSVRLLYFFAFARRNSTGSFLSFPNHLYCNQSHWTVHTVEICFSSFYYFPTLFYLILLRILPWFSHPGPDQVATYTTLGSLINAGAWAFIYIKQFSTLLAILKVICKWKQSTLLVFFQLLNEKLCQPYSFNQVLTIY